MYAELGSPGQGVDWLSSVSVLAQGGGLQKLLLLAGPMFLRRWSLLIQIIAIKTLMDNCFHVGKGGPGVQCCRVGS